MRLRTLLLVAALSLLALPAGAQADTIWTAAGNGVNCMTTCPAGGPAAGASTISQPRGLAVDADGGVYIADADFRIKRIRPDGIIEHVAGNGLACPSPTDPCGEGQLATTARLGLATDIALAANGDLFIADYNAHKIRVLRKSDGRLVTIAGNGGTSCSSNPSPPSCANGQPALGFALDRIQGIAVEPNGNIYVAETDYHRIRKLTPIGLGQYKIESFAGDGTDCGGGQCGDGSAVGDVTTDRFSFPVGMTIDPSGQFLYVADHFDQRVRRITLSTGLLTTVAGTGALCPSGASVCGDGGPATQAQLNRITDVAADSAGNVYFSDEFLHRVRRISPDGKIATVAGNGVACPSPAPCGDGGATTAGSLQEPWGMAADPASGRVYISELWNARIRFIAPPPGATTDAAQAVTGTTGTMAATLRTDGLPVTYRFDYGPTAAYGFQTAPQTATVTRAAQAVSQPLTGLGAGATVHYRIVATDAAGVSTSGLDQSFTTTGGAVTPPTVATLKSAKLSVKWKKGASNGTLDVAGTTDGAASLTVTLRKVTAQGTKPVKGWTVNATAAGPFAKKLALPKSLLPGKYRADVTGSSAGGTVVRVSKNLTLKGPPEGIPRDGFAAASKNGAPATRLPGARRTIWAIFRFAALPTKGAIHIDWILPSGRRLTGASKPKRPRVEATLSARPGNVLAAGRYKAVLMVGKTELRRISVRVG